eukprot:scaffold2334_cov357-Prasinococcus_capsulatus_cf.AAC.1
MAKGSEESTAPDHSRVLAQENVTEGLEQVVVPIEDRVSEADGVIGARMNTCRTAVRTESLRLSSQQANSGKLRCPHEHWSGGRAWDKLAEARTSAYTYPVLRQAPARLQPPAAVFDDRETWLAMLRAAVSEQPQSVQPTCTDERSERELPQARARVDVWPSTQPDRPRARSSTLATPRRRHRASSVARHFTRRSAPMPTRAP